jgi:hypothetical protein
MRRVVLAAILVLLFGDAVYTQGIAAGTTPSAKSTTTTATGWLPGGEATFNGTKLQSEGPGKLFSVIADISGRFGIFATKTGRLEIAATHETLLGRDTSAVKQHTVEYEVDAKWSQEVGHGLSVNGFFRHRCRHYSDQYSPNTVTWNSVGIEACGEHSNAKDLFKLCIDAAKVRDRGYVDYSWSSRLSGRAEHRLKGEGMSLFGTLKGERVEVMPVGRPHRDNLYGFRSEGGVSLMKKHSGVVEVVEGYIMYERRADGQPNDLQRRRWAGEGVRIHVMF